MFVMLCVATHTNSEEASTVKMSRELTIKSYEERLRKMEISSFKKHDDGFNSTIFFKYQKRCYI